MRLEYVASYRTLVKEIKNRITLNDTGLDTQTIDCTTATCPTVYDISSADYNMTVTRRYNGTTTYGYTLVLTPVSGGKFNNVTSVGTCPATGSYTWNGTPYNSGCSGATITMQIPY